MHVGDSFKAKRGEDQRSEAFFSYIPVERRIAPDHPLRGVRMLTDAAPQGTSGEPALILKTEVLLDRDGFSSGEIDGKNGDNFRKALAAFQQTKNLAASGKLDADTWSALLSDNTDPPLTSYTILQSEVAGPFDKRIPSDLAKKSELQGLSYKTPQEELAEKFHMRQDLLRRLNPNACALAAISSKICSWAVK